MQTDLKKILILNPFGIGDVLFTTPIIHTLKDAFPGLKVGYLCNPRTAEILSANPYVDFIHVYDRDEFEALRRSSFLIWSKRLSGLLNRIKRERFEAALDFSLNSPLGFFSWYVGIKRRIGFDYKKRGRFLTDKVKLSGFNEKHIVEYYADLLKFLAVGLKYRQPELFLRREAKLAVDEILKKELPGSPKFLAGIFPGAGRSWGKEAYFKHWPAEKFAGVADKLIENLGCQIIILGDFSEKGICKMVSDSMRHKAIDLSSRLSVAELAALISKLNLVITNDGGPLHMAVALGVRSVSIFGPVDELVYGPYPPCEKHIVVSKPGIGCRPCYRDFRLSTCVNNRRCIEEITEEEVLSAVKSLDLQEGKVNVEDRIF